MPSASDCPRRPGGAGGRDGLLPYLKDEQAARAPSTFPARSVCLRPLRVDRRTASCHASCREAERSFSVVTDSLDPLRYIGLMGQRPMLRHVTSCTVPRWCWRVEKTRV